MDSKKVLRLTQTTRIEKSLHLKCPKCDSGHMISTDDRNGVHKCDKCSHIELVPDALVFPQSIETEETSIPLLYDVVRHIKMGTLLVDKESGIQYVYYYNSDNNDFMLASLEAGTDGNSLENLPASVLDGDKVFQAYEPSKLGIESEEVMRTMINNGVDSVDIDVALKYVQAKEEYKEKVLKVSKVDK